MRGHIVKTMEPRTTIDKVRALFRKSDAEQTYQPLESESSAIDEGVGRPVIFAPDDQEPEQDKADEGEPFSWFEYSIFLLLGIAMLWAWYVAPALRKRLHV